MKKRYVNLFLFPFSLFSFFIEIEIGKYFASKNILKKHLFIIIFRDRLIVKF